MREARYVIEDQPVPVKLSLWCGESDIICLRATGAGADSVLLSINKNTGDIARGRDVNKALGFRVDDEGRVIIK